MIVVAIKFEDGTYYAGCNKRNSQTLLGAQLYRSKKVAQNVIDKSVNFPGTKDKSFIVPVGLQELKTGLEGNIYLDEFVIKRMGKR